MLAHVIWGEQSPFRIFLLTLYARHEVVFFRLTYRLMNTRIINNSLVKWLFYVLLVYQVAQWGITGTPVCPEDIEQFIESIGPTRIAVGPCRCRTANRACDHALETDIVIRTGFGIWRDLFNKEYREINASETVGILKKSHEQGMAQIAFKHMDIGTNENYFVICNCCADGCMPLLALQFYGPDKYPFHKGNRRAFLQSAACTGCGTCVDYCVFSARSVMGGKARIGECFGCGLCASHCPSGASRMV
ncbi:MAG: hypothetical protein MUO75_01915 [Actinobacteria bacterium]|nr:hypothetical protein [Actinomycetota bacterium]